MSKRAKVGRADVLRVIAKCNLFPLITTEISGSSYVTGDRSALDKASAEFLRIGYAPLYILSYRINGMPQRGYPRIEFHPQIMSR